LVSNLVVQTVVCLAERMVAYSADLLVLSMVESLAGQLATRMVV
jgi:hypothetical protein